MRIGEVAALTGVSARSLRYYEQQGLLHPQRDEHGWRVYDDDDLTRVEEVRSLLDAGLPVSAIQRLVGCLMPDGSTQPVQVSDDLLADLKAVHERLDSRIRCLARNRDALDKWLRTAIRHH